MKFKVLLHDAVVKALNKLDNATKERIKKSLEVLENNPYINKPGADIKKLAGTKGRREAYRLRIGDYRAIYFVFDNEIRVTDLIHRSEDYWMLD